MDRYHSIVWPMVSYHWKTIESNGCQTKNHRKTIEPNGCQSKNHWDQWLIDQKPLEKPLIPMAASKPFIQWQWWPWKPLNFHNGSNHSPKIPPLGANYSYWSNISNRIPPLNPTLLGKACIQIKIKVDTLNVNISGIMWALHNVLFAGKGPH